LDIIGIAEGGVVAVVEFLRGREIRIGVAIAAVAGGVAEQMFEFDRRQIGQASGRMDPVGDALEIGADEPLLAEQVGQQDGILDAANQAQLDGFENADGGKNLGCARSRSTLA
jgi:hypothetical protein